MNENCTIYNTVDIVSKKWSLLIILSIYKGEKGVRRYNQLKKDLMGITSKILSARLKELEAEGIVKRKVDESEIPIKVYYSLSDSGKDLIEIVQDIKKWGMKWKNENKLCNETNCKHCIF